MNDKALADRVAALGVVEAVDGFYYFTDENFHRTEALTATQTACDPRVAMALMERLPAAHYRHLGSEWEVNAETLAGGLRRARSDSLPRAIIEACVKALEQ